MDAVPIDEVPVADRQAHRRTFIVDDLGDDDSTEMINYYGGKKV